MNLPVPSFFRKSAAVAAQDCVISDTIIVFLLLTYLFTYILTCFTIIFCCVTRHSNNCKVVLQQQCDSATLIKLIFNNYKKI